MWLHFHCNTETNTSEVSNMKLNTSKGYENTGTWKLLEKMAHALPWSISTVETRSRLYLQ